MQSDLTIARRKVAGDIDLKMGVRRKSPVADRSLAIAEPTTCLPPILRTEHESVPLARGPWYKTIAPAYLGIFVWAPYFDSLWIGALPRFELRWSVALAVTASVLCYVLLFLVPASWGFRTGRPLGLVASSTFGTVGSEWITGIVIGVAYVCWYAVAIGYAVDSTLLGLRACGLIEAGRLSGWEFGPITVKSPVFLCTALFWIYITGMSGLLKLTGVVAALMRVYAPIALLLLTGVALWLVPAQGSYRVEDAAFFAENAAPIAWWPGQFSAIQLMTGYFAMAGMVSVDWGATARRRRDLMLGGLTGIVLAASWTAVMSLFVVAGAAARLHREGGWFVASALDPIPLSFRWGVYFGISGVAGGAILILFGLAALAPACYSVWAYSQRLSIHWPRLGQAGWTWIGGAFAFVLAATASASRLELIFSAMGDVFAPALGAIAGDWLWQRGRWSGLRHGINSIGVLAWGAGFGLALVLELARVVELASVEWFQPTSTYGFFTAAAVYWLLATLVLGRRDVAISHNGIGQ